MGSKTTTQVQGMPEFQEDFLKETVLPVAEEIGTQEFTPYEGDRVAGMTDLQQQAMQGYGALTLPSELQEAAGVYRGMAMRDPSERAADISQYTQQYTQNVIDPTMAALERQRGKGRMMEEAEIAKRGAFGNTRRDVYQGELEGAYQAGLGQTLGQLQAQGYQSAVARAAAEDAQRMAAAGQLGQSGLSGLQAQQSILGAQTGAGEAQRQLAQQGLDYSFEEFMRQQQYPLTQFGVLTGAAGAIPQGYGTTSGTSRDPFGTAGMLMSGVGALGMGGIIR